MTDFLKSAALALAGAVLWTGSLPAAETGPGPGAAPPVTAVGRIADVQADANRFTLHTGDGNTLTLYVDERSELRLHHRPAALDQFKEGTRVRVTYQSQAGREHVLTMTEAPRALEDLRRETNAALRAARSYTFEHKEEYQKRLQGVLDQIQDQIDQLKHRAEQAGTQVQQKYPQQLEELRRLKAKAQTRLERVKAATPGAWEDIKAGVGAAMEDLQKAFERASKRFQ